jgi:hypothetical protein
MPHGQDIEAAAKFQPLRKLGQPHAQHQQIRDGFVPFPLEIVQTQMTKWRGFAFWPGGHDIADFYLRIVDDDAIDEQLDQLPALGTRQLVQRRLQTLTKRLDSFGQPRHVDVLLGLGITLSQLLRQSLVAVSHLLSFPLEFFPLDDLSQVYIEQPSLLTFELCQDITQRLTSGLKSLGQPLAHLRPFEFMSKEGRFAQHAAEVLPDQLV